MVDVADASPGAAALRARTHELLRIAPRAFPRSMSGAAPAAPWLRVRPRHQA